MGLWSESLLFKIHWMSKIAFAISTMDNPVLPGSMEQIEATSSAIHQCESRFNSFLQFASYINVVVS